MTSQVSRSAPCRRQNAAMGAPHLAYSSRSHLAQSHGRTASSAEPVSRAVRQNHWHGKSSHTQSCEWPASTCSDTHNWIKCSSSGNNIHWPEGYRGSFPFHCSQHCLIASRLARPRCTSVLSFNASFRYIRHAYFIPNTLLGKLFK